MIAGALLDRNGFRPARYLRTRDDRLYLGSEAGIFDLPDSAIVARRRLAPGGLVLADTRTGKILETAAARRRMAAARPYRALVTRTVIPAETLGSAPETGDLPPSDLRCRQRLFGCTQEEIDLVSGRWPETAPKPSVRWVTTRRWRHSPASTACCRIISVSGSRR